MLVFTFGFAVGFVVGVLVTRANKSKADKAVEVVKDKFNEVKNR